MSQSEEATRPQIVAYGQAVYGGTVFSVIASFILGCHTCSRCPFATKQDLA